MAADLIALAEIATYLGRKFSGSEANKVREAIAEIERHRSAADGAHVGAENERLLSVLRDVEPTVMLTTVSDGPAVELLIEDREAAIRCYEALEAACAVRADVRASEDPAHVLA